MEMDGPSLVKHQATITTMDMDAEMKQMFMQSAFTVPMRKQNLTTKHKVLLVHYFI